MFHCISFCDCVNVVCDREVKEMDNFINLLDNTLKMNNDNKSDDEEELTEVPVDNPRPKTAPGVRPSLNHHSNDPVSYYE